MQTSRTRISHLLPESKGQDTQSISLPKEDAQNTVLNRTTATVHTVCANKHVNERLPEPQQQFTLYVPINTSLSVYLNHSKS